MREVTIAEEVPDISCRFHLDGDGPYSENEVLIVSFSGDYRDGSSGRSDAAYIRHMIEMASGFWWHTGLVVDLSALSYGWGDEMEVVFDFMHGVTSTAIVVGPGCRPALSSLLFGLYTERDVTEHELIFDDLDEALQFVRTKAKQKFAQYEQEGPYK